MDETKSTNLPFFLQKGVLLSQAPQHVWVAENWSKKAVRSQDLGFQGPYGGTCFYSPEFDLKYKDEVIVVPHTHKMTALELAAALPEMTTAVSMNLDWRPESEVYEQDYQEIIKRIDAGELIKAVPFMNYVAPKPENFQTEILPYVLQNLLQRSDIQFVYGLWDEESGFVGSTPEILVEGTPEELRVMALAGTQAIEDQSDMLQNTKLYDEHMVVVDDIAEKLSGAELSWGETHEAPYGPLKHLRTMGTLKDFKGVLGTLIMELSPTSALGVYPKDQLQKNLDVLHADARGSYGAPFGVIDHGFAHFIVCLRGLFWDQTHLRIRVGGGVIAQSHLEDELKELELKFMSTKTKLGL